MLVHFVNISKCFHWFIDEKSDNSIYSQFSKQDKEKAQTLLFTSIESNYFDLLKELLELGVDIDIKNEVGVAYILYKVNSVVTAVRIKPRLFG